MKNKSLLKKFIGYILWKLGKYKFRVKVIRDNPKHEDIKDNLVYIVGGEDYVKWAYLNCPNKCGEVIMLNLSNSKKPLWKVEFDKKGRVTIHPSIHKLDGCESHFWIIDGNIKWC